MRNTDKIMCTGLGALFLLPVIFGILGDRYNLAFQIVCIFDCLVLVVIEHYCNKINSGGNSK
jgi:hypothetical protein